MLLTDIQAIAKDYKAALPLSLQADFEELIALMNNITPDAIFSIQQGVPLFELGKKPLYGIVFRAGHLSLYIPEPLLLETYSQRLKPALVSSDSVMFNHLKELNLNVVAELLSRVKGNFLYPKDENLH